MGHGVDQPAVVAGEHEEGIVGNACLCEAVHDLADSMVQLGDEIGVQTQPRRIGLIEVGVDRFGRVHVRKPDVGEERLIASASALALALM